MCESARAVCAVFILSALVVRTAVYLYSQLHVYNVFIALKLNLVRFSKMAHATGARWPDMIMYLCIVRCISFIFHKITSPIC